MYEITIKKIEIVTQTRKSSWEAVSERPLSKQDVEEAHFSDVSQYQDKLKKVYGYTPTLNEQVEVSHEILKQTVEDLDLNKVIKAINGL